MLAFQWTGLACNDLRNLLLQRERYASAIDLPGNVSDDRGTAKVDRKKLEFGADQQYWNPPSVCDTNLVEHVRISSRHMCRDDVDGVKPPLFYRVIPELNQGGFPGSNYRPTALARRFKNRLEYFA